MVGGDRSLNNHTVTLTLSVVPLVTVETHGSNCFYQSLSMNDGPFVGDVASRAIPNGTTAEHNTQHGVTVAHLASLTSKATSLGASSPSAAVVKMALEREGGTACVTISDEMAMESALSFAGLMGLVSLKAIHSTDHSSISRRRPQVPRRASLFNDPVTRL